MLVIMDTKFTTFYPVLEAFLMWDKIIYCNYMLLYIRFGLNQTYSPGFEIQSSLTLKILDYTSFPRMSAHILQ